MSITNITAADIPTAVFSFLDTPRNGQIPRNFERMKFWVSMYVTRMESSSFE